MAKKKKTKQIDFKNPFVIGAGLVIVMLLALQVAAFSYMNQRISQLEGGTIRALMIDGVNSLERPAVIDPQTGRQHFPAARLVLPPHDRLALGYGGDKDIVNFSDKANMGSATGALRNTKTYDETLQAVPRLQACSRQVVVMFKQANMQHYTLAHTKQLADGRQAYIYDSEVCRGDRTTLVNHVKNIESY